MNQASTTTVLICLCGMSPAVITETVYALAHEKPPIIPDEVIALTTTEGRDCIVSELFDGGVWSRLRADLGAAEGRLLFGPSAHCVRVVPCPDRSGDAADVADSDIVSSFADFVLAALRQFTENADCRVLLSIAGGRKTMSASAALAMTLLGRREDRMLHVLVNPPFDNPSLRPRFYFPPPAPSSHVASDNTPVLSSSARVVLHDVPFVRCRYLFETNIHRLPGSFSGTVELANRQIAEAGEVRLVLDPCTVGCRVNDKELRLSVPEYVLFWMLCERRRAGRPPLRGEGNLHAAFVAFANGIGRERMPELINHHLDKKTGDDVRKMISSLRRKMAGQLVAREAAACLPPGERGVYACGLEPKDIRTG